MTRPAVSGPEGRRSEVLAATHAWFEVNSGWAPPDPATMADWAAEGACRAPDECWVELHGSCPHGLASWQLVLDDIALHDARHATRPRPTRPGPPADAPG